MRVAITANRDLAPGDFDRIERAMRDLCALRPNEIIFGGARGGDTVALEWAGFYRIAPTRLVVIVPDTIMMQSREAQSAIRLWSDEVVELRNPITRDDRFAAMKVRNAAMIDRAHEANGGRLLGFWDGDRRSGTYSCLAYAVSVWCPLWVVPIEGGDR
jgi:hypothetical protein